MQEADISTHLRTGVSSIPMHSIGTYSDSQSVFIFALLLVAMMASFFVCCIKRSTARILDLRAEIEMQAIGPSINPESLPVS
jgi:hypothetical protein